MSNLVEHAKRELELIGAFSEDDDFYGGMTGKAVMELIEVFAEQGHSGMSASIVRSLFSKLADYKPLAPLTFKDDEWNDPDDPTFDNGDTYQNKRNSAVFKAGKDGRPHYIHAYTMKAGDRGNWGGSLELEGNKRVRRCYIKDPKEMPTVVINIPTVQYGDNASDWEFLRIPEDHPDLQELKKYYDLEIVKEK